MKGLRYRLYRIVQVLIFEFKATFRQFDDAKRD